MYTVREDINSCDEKWLILVFVIIYAHDLYSSIFTKDKIVYLVIFTFAIGLALVCSTTVRDFTCLNFGDFFFFIKYRYYNNNFRGIREFAIFSSLRKLKPREYHKIYSIIFQQCHLHIVKRDKLLFCAIISYLNRMFY